MENSFLNNQQQQTQEIVEIFEWNDHASSDMDSSDNDIQNTIIKNTPMIRTVPSESDNKLQAINMLCDQPIPSKTLDSLNMEMNATQNANTTVSNPEITVINKTIYSNKCCVMYIIILNLLLLYGTCSVTYLLVNYDSTSSCECNNINKASIATDTTNSKHFIGDLKVSMQNMSHGNWILCDGSYINKNKYPKLFNLFGYTFGLHSENISLFQLPNGKGKVIGIIDELKYNIGDIMGNESIVLGINNMPKHNHFVASANNYGNGDIGDYLEGVYSYLADEHNVSKESKYQLKATNTIPKRYRSSDSGFGENVNVMQPTIFMGNLFVYAG